MNRAPSTLLRKSSALLAFALLTLPMLPGVEAYPRNGLVGEWQFEEGTGTAVADSSGNGNHGGLVNTVPSVWQPGHSGSGVSLDGSDDRVIIAHSASLQPSQISVMTWVKFDSFRGGAGCGGTASFIISKGGDQQPGNYRLYVCQASGGMKAVYGHTTLANGFAGQTTLQVNTWYHLAATFDGTQQRIYVNGALDGSHSTTIPIGSNTAPVWLGRHSVGSFPYPLDATIDEVRIYNRALSASEIALVMDQASLPGAPANPAVTNGPDNDGLTLTWDAPTEPGTGPITGYKVYGGDTLGQETPLGETGPTVFSFEEANLGYNHVRYYRVSAVNAYGEGEKALASGTTYSAGRMQLSNLPGCAPEFPPFVEYSIAYCNSERFGFTDDIDASDPAAPTFAINWGDFNGHEHVGCGSEACTYWMELDLGVDSPATSYAAYDSQTVPVAQLQRLIGASWVDVEGGLISAEIDAAPGQSWELIMPGRLLLTHEAMGTSAGSQAFRLAALDRPEGGGVWDLDFHAAMAQLVAPPVLLVHGWNPHVGEANYTDDAGWGRRAEPNMIDRAYFVHGQDPWEWSGVIIHGEDDGAIKNPTYDGKTDFRLSAFVIYDRILELRADPHEPGDSLSYAGPVNIITHSMGGLISRYLLESILPDLTELNHGTLRAQDSISRELNQHSHLDLIEPDDLVASLVMMSTPNLGSNWARGYITGNDRATYVLGCLKGSCDPHYLAQPGSNLLKYGFRGRSVQPWWNEPVGAYQNWRHFDDPVHLSLMADFELQGRKDGNPVLEELEDRMYSRRGVHYFHMAGDYVLKTDGIVSVESATHGYDDAACYHVYDNAEVTYGTHDTETYRRASHSIMPGGKKIHYDALAFMAGEKESLCDNQPEYGGSSNALEGNGVLSSMAMSMQAQEFTLESQEAEQAPYEAPIAWNLTAAEGAYSIRFDWDAPGASTGTLALLDLNATLDGATVELRAPSGATASWAAGNTSLAEWMGPEPFGDENETLLLVRLPQAEQGAWTAWINRSTEWPSIIVPTVLFETTLGIASQSDTRVVIGEPATYRIRLTDTGNPVLGAAVSLDLVDPGSGESETLNLTDDGLGADAQAADGVYSTDHTFQANGTAPYLATATFAGTQLVVEGGIAVLDEAPAPRSFPSWMPLNLSAVRGPGGHEITLTWGPPVGGPALTGYDVYRGNETNQVLVASIGNTTTYTDTGLDDNATYHYRVASTNDAGWSQRSNLANATTFDVPSAPIGLTATSGEEGEIVLAWQSPASDGGTSVTNYTVYGGDSLGSLAVLATVNDLAYTETGLDDNVTRFYRVAAVNDAGEGPTSAHANATTITVAASAPLNLTVTAGSGAGQLTLTWQPPADDGGDAVVNYTVYRGANPQAMSLLATVGSVPGYMDSGLGNDATWHYAVAAVNAADEGPRSAAANGTTFDVPTAPWNLTAEPGPGAGEITLAWQAPSSDGGTPVTNYTVYGGSSSGNRTVLATLGDVQTFTESGLGNDVTRYYAVSATNLAGEGNQSDQASAATFAEPTAPQNLEAQAGIGNVSLTWEPAALDGGMNVTGYNVYRGNASGAETLYTSLGVVLDYIDENAMPGTRYYYRVSSLNEAGEGALSNEVSARPSSLLLSLPGIPLPPIGVQPTGATVTVCDAGSDAGCAIPGASHVCVELRVAAQPAVKLACIDHALVPPEVDAVLHGLLPIEVGHPGGAGSTPGIQVTYLHEAALLNQILVACAPVHPTLDDATWLLANGNETSLTVTLKPGSAPGDSVTLPWLGQLVAAGQATLGGIPCG